MALFAFGDGFDPYNSYADLPLGYWDTGTGSGYGIVAAGRFTNGQALYFNTNAGPTALVKNSGTTGHNNVHFNLAFRQTPTITGSTLGMTLQLMDGNTAQCCIVFRSDGAILLTQGGPTGTVLATYANAFPLNNVWYGFEFEVILSATVGRFRARRNGNPADDFDSGASLNTIQSGAAQMNRLGLGMQTGVNQQQIDDLLWRSDSAAVPFVGDIRSYNRMPNADVQTQFTPSLQPVQNTQGATVGTIAAGTARYTTQMVAPVTGNLTSINVTLNQGFTGNLKAAVFASNGNPTTVLATANVLTNPVTGINTLTFATPPSIAKNVGFHVGYCSDTSSGSFTCNVNAGFTSTTPYASFPAASPSVTTLQPGPNTTANFLPTASNNSMVNELTQDDIATYVYSSTVGQADFYTTPPISPAPSLTICTVTRGFIKKTDAGSRSGAVQLKSGATTVNTGPQFLPSTFIWSYRTDITNPNTGAAWTAAQVDAAQIGPVVSA